MILLNNGGTTELYGLYLINPQDIHIEESSFSVVNCLNEKIRQYQEQNNSQEKKSWELTPRQKESAAISTETTHEENASLEKLLYELERAVKRARDLSNSAAMAFAPEGAEKPIIERQKIAYIKLLDRIKNSTREEQNSILIKILDSTDLTNEIKVAFSREYLSIDKERFGNER